MPRKERLLGKTGFAPAQLTEVALAESGASVGQRGEMATGKDREDFLAKIIMNSGNRKCKMESWSLFC